MIDAPVVILDMNYLAYRALYSTGGLSDKGNATGVLYGVMRFVRDMEGRWPLAKLIFCFDKGKNVREEIYPGYKLTRRLKRAEEMKDPAKKKVVKGFRRQVEQLREELLEKAGYRNVFAQEGYEADDIMAQVVKQLRHDTLGNRISPPDTYLVTGDKDLYQCVSGMVGVWHPQKPGEPPVRADVLLEKYGVLPAQWAQVKCIAGCSSDDIPGVPGIGEKKAAAFVGWATDGDSKVPCPGVGADKVNEILEFMCSKEYVRNRLLVKLPLKGTDPVKIRKDTPNPDAWNQVVHGFGGQSLVKGDKARSRLEGIF